MLLPLYLGVALGWSSVMNGLVQAQQGRYGEVFLNKSDSHYLLLQRPRLHLACLVVLLQFPLYSFWRRKSPAPCPF